MAAVSPRNMVVGAPNYVRADPRFATVRVLDGVCGSWVNDGDLAPGNILLPSFARLIRSTDVAKLSTRILLDLGALRSVQVAGVPRMAASRAAQYRITAYETSDIIDPVTGEVSATPVSGSDSGWLDLYPVIFGWGSLPFEHPSWLDGKMTEEDAAIFPMPAVVVYDTAVIARYWLLEIDDSASDRAYVELPFIYFCPGWQPTHDKEPGAQLGIEDPTVIETSLGGAEFPDILDQKRVVHATIPFLEEDEALAQVFDTMKRLGTHGQAFFIWDPTDTVHRHRRWFPCRLRTLSPIEATAVTGYSKSVLEFLEIIA